jgi:hypothetical protein
MKSFYVDCHLPQGGAAELSAEFDTFDETLAWIDDRLHENPRRIPRLLSRVRVTAKMARLLTEKGVILRLL